jgi:copper chaperone CopZ
MSATAARVARLDIPELVERPVVGTTCCASTAEAIVVQELLMLPGIGDVAVDPRAGTVMVSFDPAVASLDEIRAALAEIGYPAA